MLEPSGYISTILSHGLSQVKISVELNKRPNVDGRSVVYIRAYHNGVRLRHTLPIRVKPSDWSDNLRRVKFNAPNATAFNRAIVVALEQAEGFVAENRHATPGDVIAYMAKPVHGKGTRLVEALQAQYKEHAHRIKYGTRKGRITVLRDVEQVLPGATIGGLSVSDVLTLDRYYVERNLKTNSRRSRLRRLRTMYNSACRMAGDEPRDLFRGLIPAPVKTVKQFQTPANIDKMRVASLPTRTIQLGVDSFLLQYDLGGLRFGDVCRLHHDMILDSAFRWIEGKVPKPRYHPINEKAWALIRKYGSGGMVLPLIKEGLTGDELDKAIESANHSVNRSLRIACEMVGVPRVRTHNARHSAAKRIAGTTKDMRAAQMILGHARLSQTEEYMDELDTSAVDAIMQQLDQ